VILHFCDSWEQETSMWRRQGRCCHSHWCGARSIRLIESSQNIRHHRLLRITFLVAGIIVIKVRLRYNSLLCFKHFNIIWMRIRFIEQNCILLLIYLNDWCCNLSYFLLVTIMELVILKVCLRKQCPSNFISSKDKWDNTAPNCYDIFLNFLHL